MECRFCDIHSGNYHYKEIDQPFLKNTDFFAIASIGALVEGWSLIIPKDHQLSMKSCYQNKSFQKIVNDILPSMKHKYGNIIAFEHGANKEGSLTACGTDHAHMHLVPFGSLHKDMMDSGLKWKKCLSSDIGERINNKEYLFYVNLENIVNWKNPEGYLHVLNYPISQFFRTLIATKIGKLDVSNYKDFPHLENSKITKKSLEKLIA